MSLELELWAMNSARISALEAGGGGGGSTSDLCIRVPKFDMYYMYEHMDEVITVEMEEESSIDCYVEFTVPDDGKAHYAIIASDLSYGIPSSLILMESCGGRLLDGDDLVLSEMSGDKLYPVYSHALYTGHQTILYDPEREDVESKAYSIGYRGDSYCNPILLKNGSEYKLLYEKGIFADTGDAEIDEYIDNIRDAIASSTLVYIVPGTYEEIPVVVRNGGNT